MNKKLKHKLIDWLTYTIICYVVLIPFGMWVTGISLSILFGFIAGMLNSIIIQLRKLNGEKFPNIDNDE